MIQQFVVIFLASAITNNILLTNFLGMCPFLAISKQMRAAFGIGLAVIFVTGFTSMINWLVEYQLLRPLGLESFRFIVFIMVIASFVQVVEMFVERTSASLYAALGIFLPLITVNCAILGTSLLMLNSDYTFVESIFYGFGSGLGWTIAILAMAAIRERMAKTAKVPPALDGPGITLIIAGLMSMAFVGFSGMFN
jgi:Na+-transporting NADH:ubiquinone oxidoreductase subunit E